MTSDAKFVDKYFHAKQDLFDTTERLRNVQFDLVDERTVSRHLAYCLYCSGLDPNKMLQDVDLVFVQPDRRPAFNAPTELPESPETFRARYPFTSWESIKPTPTSTTPPLEAEHVDSEDEALPSLDKVLEDTPLNEGAEASVT